MSARQGRYWLNLRGFASVTLLIGLAGAFVYGSYRGATAYVHPPRTLLTADDTPARFGVAF